MSQPLIDSQGKAVMSQGTCPACFSRAGLRRIMRPRTRWYCWRKR